MPQITSTLFFFIRKPTPPLSCFDTARERATTFSMSNETSFADSPNSLAWFMWSYISAERSSALVGMQPQLRQMPPRCLFSTIAVFSPSCDARIAVTYPPGPEPMMMTS